MRCVCKSWNSLLSKSSFVKAHLHHSAHNNDETHLLFHRGSSFECTPLTLCPSRSPNLEPTNLIKLPVHLQSKTRKDYGGVIGSVNGLICFYYISHSSCSRDYSVYIWNPSLSAVLTLPPCSLPAGDPKQIHFRFGFDPKTDNYKIVKLTSPTLFLQAEVYSMRKGSWEIKSQRFPCDITMIRQDDDVCVDGHVHWICYTDLTFKSITIVAFDLSAETFREMPLPYSIIPRHEFRFNHFGVLNGKLCVMSCVQHGESQVWVMNEYGVAESWVKHHTFSKFMGYMCPYGFTSNNEFLFRVDSDSFALYDPVAATTKKTFNIKGVSGAIKVVEYVDSLVWVAPAEHDIRTTKNPVTISLASSIEDVWWPETNFFYNLF